MMRQLLVYPQPKQGQSVACYIETLARSNGDQSAKMLVEKTLRVSKYQPDRLSIRQIQTLTGHSMEDIQRLELLLSDDHSQPTYYYGRLPIPSYHLSRHHWFCPDCVREQSYLRAKWRIAWLPVCLVHRRALMRADKAVWSDGKLVNLADAANDDCMDEQLYEVLTQLNDSLEHERVQSRPIPGQRSVIDRVDEQLRKSLGRSRFERLLNRRQKYSWRYCPFNEQRKRKFVQCLHTQLLET